MGISILLMTIVVDDSLGVPWLTGVAPPARVPACFGPWLFRVLAVWLWCASVCLFVAFVLTMALLGVVVLARLCCCALVAFIFVVMVVLVLV